MAAVRNRRTAIFKAAHVVDRERGHSGKDLEGFVLAPVFLSKTIDDRKAFDEFVFVEAHEVDTVAIACGATIGGLAVTADDDRWTLLRDPYEPDTMALQDKVDWMKRFGDEVIAKY